MLRVFKGGTKPLSKGILRQRSKNGTLWLNKAMQLHRATWLRCMQLVRARAELH